MQLKTRCIPNAEQLSYVCRIVQSSIVSNKEKKEKEMETNFITKQENRQWYIRPWKFTRSESEWALDAHVHMLTLMLEKGNELYATEGHRVSQI